MSSIAAIAIETLQTSGQPLPGVTGKLVFGSGMQDLVIMSNKDGYEVFKEVPIPFEGSLRLAGTAQFVEYPISIPADAVNVTLRVGGTSQGPFDQVLPAVIPFV